MELLSHNNVDSSEKDTIFNYRRKYLPTQQVERLNLSASLLFMACWFILFFFFLFFGDHMLIHSANLGYSILYVMLFASFKVANHIQSYESSSFGLWKWLCSCRLEAGENDWLINIIALENCETLCLRSSNIWKITWMTLQVDKCQCAWKLWNIMPKHETSSNKLVIFTGCLPYSTSISRRCN